MGKVFPKEEKALEVLGGSDVRAVILFLIYGEIALLQTRVGDAVAKNLSLVSNENCKGLAKM